VSRADRGELDAREILARLTRRGVDFVVIGGIAAVLHGSARMTFDLDVCFATDPGNLQALGDTLVELDARLKGIRDDVPFVPDPATLRRVEALTLSTAAGELDVLTRPAGAPRYSTLRARADRYDLDGFSVLVASIDHLLAMKRAAVRAKDRADAEELEEIRRLRRGAG